VAFSDTPGVIGRIGRGSIQRLDLRLLVDAEHDGLVRWVQIQPDHIADLGLQLGVGGERERLDTPGQQPPLLPDLADPDVRDPQFGAQ
jgi:hypothetical protein